MKIGMNEILSGIEYTAIQKITKELVRDGLLLKTNFHQNKTIVFFSIFMQKKAKTSASMN